MVTELMIKPRKSRLCVGIKTDDFCGCTTNPSLSKVNIASATDTAQPSYVFGLK